VSGDEFAALPSPLQDHLRDHVEALTRLQVLAREHAELYEATRTSHMAALRAAVTIHRAESLARAERRACDDANELAGVGRRDLTRGEARRLAEREIPTPPSIFEQVRSETPMASGDETLRFLSQIRIRE